MVAEAFDPSFGVPGRSINWTMVSRDGTLGALTEVGRVPNPGSASVAAASSGETSAIVWGGDPSDGPEHSLNSLQVNASGEVVTEASVLALGGRSAAPEIVRTRSGYALLWMDGEQTFAKLTFALLDENAKLASAPVVIAEGQSLTAGTIAPIADHFVVSYMDDQYYDAGTASRLLVLDSDGSVLGPPITLEASPTTGMSVTVPALHVRGNQVLAAWSVTRGDNSVEVQEAATTIRVARFDANGERQGPMYDVQAPVNDREAVQAWWVEVGDDVGLLWSDGSIIYSCGGCILNHSLKFVVLDGQTFLPQSNVVELVNPLLPGGLWHPRTAPVGDELLVVSTLEHLTAIEGVSAAIQCVQ